MKLYVLNNESRYSQVMEALGSPADSAESAKVDQFVCGKPAPQLAEPLKVRIHFKAAKPQPLPDFWRGAYLCFVSERGKAILEHHFSEFAQFVPVEVVGFGVDSGRSWRPVGMDESPFSVIPPYHVLHVPGVAEILDEARSRIVRDSIGELPQLFPVGQFHTLAFKRDVVVPPLFALPHHANHPVVSDDFVAVAKREKLSGCRAVEVFDTAVDFECEGAGTQADGELVSLQLAMRILSGVDR